MPAAIPRMFLSAPASSTPSASVLVYTRNASCVSTSRIWSIERLVRARNDHRSRQSARQLLGMARSAQHRDGRAIPTYLLDDLAGSCEGSILDAFDNAQNGHDRGNLGGERA